MNGLYSLKTWFTKALTPGLRLAVRLKISPNWLTLLGVLGAALASYAFVTRVAWLVFLGLVIRLAGANLDGAVARAQGRSGSKAGFWINELGDRLSDVIVLFAPILMVTNWLTVSSLVAASLPTLVSLWGYSRIGIRINGGPVGKTERCALVFLAVIWSQYSGNVGEPLYWLSLSIILGSLLTAVLRVRQVERLLENG